MVQALTEERLERRAALQAKRAVRRAAKEQEDQDNAAREALNPTTAQAATTKKNKSNSATSVSDTTSPLLELPEVALQLIYTLLSAADLGRLTLASKSLNKMLPEARVAYLLARLYRPNSHSLGTVGYTAMLADPAHARRALEQSHGGGETGRVRPTGKYARSVTNEFVAYARFIEQAVTGYSHLDTGSSSNSSSSSSSNSASLVMLPRHVQGRFASVSPEHSLCRVGGDGHHTGAGGSGVASWGVGKRGQLGHGKRRDERLPVRLLGGLGYGIRIVQVSAGGGLVRVAHSLLLTSTGRVLSFGTGQYGALGHGYSAAKQLPDQLRPKYIQEAGAWGAGTRVVCVAAGELHSAVVTADGDVYTWGDGFCGQLGHGDKRPQTTPKQVVVGGLEDEVVASICCGSRHTLAVTEDGDVFSFGLGHFGVLGRSFTPFDYDADAAVVAFTGEGGGVEHHVAMPVANGAAAAAVVPPQQEHPLAAIRAAQADAEPNYAADLMAHLDLIANLTLEDSSDQCIPTLIESLQGIKIVGASAGHRHSLLLDEHGSVYSFGAGIAGCLGHGDLESQMYPVKILEFDHINARILQLSAGVDMSMAVSTTGDVYAWGKTDEGRIGLGLKKMQVTLPRRVSVTDPDGAPVKAVDVECGYVHSLVVGLDGTLHLCGGVGIEGEADGQAKEEAMVSTAGLPRQVADFNVWHRLPEPTEFVKKEKWKKFGKYEVKGRSKMMS